MSESQVEGAGAPVAPPAAVVAGAVDKREWATRTLTEILRLMELPARIETKDAPDGGISVALFFEGEVPGVQAGRRSHLIDSLQFLVNKIVNRPSTERRWIAIGVGGHPEPRPAQPQQRAQQPVAQQPPPRANGTHDGSPAAASVPAGNGVAPQSLAPPPPAPAFVAAPVAAAPAPAVDPRGGKRGSPPQQRNGAGANAREARAQPPDEHAIEVPADPDLAKAIRAMAEKSAALGRYYAIGLMGTEDRARTLKAAHGVAGVKVNVEGEGRARRVLFTPDKPAPMPKRTVPDYGEDEDA